MRKFTDFRKLLLDNGFTSLRDIIGRLYVKGNQYIIAQDYGEDGYEAYQNITTKNILISKDMITVHPEIEIADLKDKLRRRNMQIKELKSKGILEGLNLSQKIVSHYGEAWLDSLNSITSHIEKFNR